MDPESAVVAVPVDYADAPEAAAVVILGVSVDRAGAGAALVASGPSTEAAVQSFDGPSAPSIADAPQTGNCMLSDSAFLVPVQALLISTRWEIGSDCADQPQNFLYPWWFREDFTFIKPNQGNSGVGGQWSIRADQSAPGGCSLRLEWGGGLRGHWAEFALQAPGSDPLFRCTGASIEILAASFLRVDVWSCGEHLICSVTRLLLRCIWEVGKDGSDCGSDLAHMHRRWQFRKDHTFEKLTTFGFGVGGQWSIRADQSAPGGCSLRLEWGGGLRGHWAEFVLQAPGSDPLFRCTGSTIDFMLDWALRAAPSVDLEPPLGSITAEALHMMLKQSTWEAGHCDRLQNGALYYLRQFKFFRPQNGSLAAFGVSPFIHRSTVQTWSLYKDRNVGGFTLRLEWRHDARLLHWAKFLLIIADNSPQFYCCAESSGQLFGLTLRRRLPGAEMSLSSILIHNDWEIGSDSSAATSDCYSFRPWRFNEDFTFSKLMRDGSNGSGGRWSLPQRDLVLRVEWDGGLHGHWAEFALQAPGSDPLFRCTGSSLLFMRPWSMRVSPWKFLRHRGAELDVVKRYIISRVWEAGSDECGISAYHLRRWYFREDHTFQVAKAGACPGGQWLLREDDAVAGGCALMMEWEGGLNGHWAEFSIGRPANGSLFRCMRTSFDFMRNWDIRVVVCAGVDQAIQSIEQSLPRCDWEVGDSEEGENAYCKRIWKFREDRTFCKIEWHGPGVGGQWSIRADQSAPGGCSLRLEWGGGLRGHWAEFALQAPGSDPLFRCTSSSIDTLCGLNMRMISVAESSVV